MAPRPLRCHAGQLWYCVTGMLPAAQNLSPSGFQPPGYLLFSCVCLCFFHLGNNYKVGGGNQLSGSYVRQCFALHDAVCRRDADNLDDDNETFVYMYNSKHTRNYTTDHTSTIYVLVDEASDRIPPTARSGTFRQPIICYYYVLGAFRRPNIYIYIHTYMHIYIYIHIHITIILLIPPTARSGAGEGLRGPAAAEHDARGRLP